jgi:dimeric dUTPase (all-alpha-NTP-PPase superfamily)
MNNRALTFGQYKNIQNILNEHTIKNWKSKLTTNDFKVAMFDEFAELLNSGSWKWWKNKTECDIWNLKIESVDIFHFALSIYILKRNSTMSDECIIGEYNNDHNYMISAGMIDHNVFINRAISALTTTDPTSVETLFDSLGMSAEEITAIYVAKSELNFIRQDNGYKTGEYVKIVDGMEDNERMESVVNDFLEDGSITIDQLRLNVRDKFYTNGEQ